MELYGEKLVGVSGESWGVTGGSIRGGNVGEKEVVSGENSDNGSCFHSGVRECPGENSWGKGGSWGNFKGKSWWWCLGGS